MRSWSFSAVFLYVILITTNSFAILHSNCKWYLTFKRDPVAALENVDELYDRQILKFERHETPDINAVYHLIYVMKNRYALLGEDRGSEMATLLGRILAIGTQIAVMLEMDNGMTKEDKRAWLALKRKIFAIYAAEKSPESLMSRYDRLSKD